MGLFGLGSFGEGFVKGFATEANEALKRDIERINTRVEKVADFQVQKSIKEQDKRKDELEDIEEAIAMAWQTTEVKRWFVFKTEDNREGRVRKLSREIYDDNKHIERLNETEKEFDIRMNKLRENA